MVRSILMEVALVAAILGLVGTWRFTPPPRGVSDILCKRHQLDVAIVHIASEPGHIFCRHQEHDLRLVLMIDICIYPGQGPEHRKYLG